MQKLQPENLDTFYAQLFVAGRRNGAGGGLAPKTVRIIHGIIRKALADAQRKGTVIRNVAGLAEPPKVRVKVILAEPYDPIVFARSRSIDGTSVVSTAQVAADLLTGPGRMPQEGDALLGWMRANTTRWQVPRLG